MIGVHPVQGGVEQAETVPGVLVGDRDDAREQRRRLAGAPDQVKPAMPSQPGVQVDQGRAVHRGAHRDIREPLAGPTAPATPFW